MNGTIRSVVRIANEDRENVLSTLTRFKAVQDIPFSNIELIEAREDTLELSLDYPLDVFDRSVTQFLALLFGELPYMRGLGELRFLDLKLPEEAFAWFGGPTHGVEGIHQRLGVENAPLLMSIIKPSVDLELDRAGQLQKLRGPLEAGFHAVKDDEMLGSLGKLPLEVRLQLARENPGYVPAVNVDDPGAYATILGDPQFSMVILNATIIGFPLLQRLSRDTRVPILSHLSLQGTYDKSFSPRLYAFLHRLFGCDAFITAIGGAGYYGASKEDEIAMAEALTECLPILPTLPLLTGGARPANVRELMATHERAGRSYGLVFGSFVFNSDRSPKEMAAQVHYAVEQAKVELRSARSCRRCGGK